MSFLLSLLGTIATILVLLNRMGVNLGGLNPSNWRRRRNWQKKYHGHPAFEIDHPMDATALLLCVIAKIDGDMTSNEKHALQGIFQNTFKLTETDAAKLLLSSIYLLGSDDEVLNNPEVVLENVLGKFSEEQKHSALVLFEEVANIDGEATAPQRDCIEKLKQTLLPDIPSSERWH